MFHKFCRLRISALTFVLLLCISSLLCAGELESPVDFSFVQICDTQLGFGGYAHDVDMFMQAVAQINEIDPDFVIICGDLVNHVNKTSVTNFLEIKSALKVPSYCVSGNHDVGNEPTDETLKKYRELFGKDYYSFSFKDYEFVIVNTQVWKFPHKTETAKQDIWLAQTLAQAKAKKHPVVIAGHYPLYLSAPQEENGYYNLPKETRLSLLELFSKSGVVAVLGGHTHKFIENEYKGIKLVNGETTSKNFDGSEMGFRLWKVLLSGDVTHEFIRINDQ